MTFYKLLGVFIAALLAFAHAHMTFPVTGYPVTVPVDGIAAALVIGGILAGIALLAWHIARDGVRTCSCAGGAR